MLWRCRRGLWQIQVQTHGTRCGVHKVRQSLRNVSPHGRRGQVIWCLLQSGLRAQGHGGQGGLIRNVSFLREPLQVTRYVRKRYEVAGRTQGQLLNLLNQSGFDLGQARGRTHRLPPSTLVPSHDGSENTRCGVISKQRFSQVRLNAEHVNQETQSAQIPSQAIKNTRCLNMSDIHFRRRQTVHFITHAQQRRGSLVHAQHRQHAAHRRKLIGDRNQHLGFTRVAEKLIDLFFDFRERRTQLLNHAAHGLAVRHAAVQVLNPRLQGFWCCPLTHSRHAFGQALNSAFLAVSIQLPVLQAGFNVEQAGRHFHRQRCRRRGT